MCAVLYVPDVRDPHASLWSVQTPFQISPYIPDPNWFYTCTCFCLIIIFKIRIYTCIEKSSLLYDEQNVKGVVASTQ